MGGPRRRCHRGLYAGRHRPRAARHRLRRSGPRGQGPGAVDARARVLPDGDRQRRDQERDEHSRVADQPARGRAGHHPRHGRRDTGRRGALGAHQGQVADVDVDRDRDHRARGGPAVVVDDDVRTRRQSTALGRRTSMCCAASRTVPAASPSSFRCRSCTRIRRCIWPARRVPGPPTATTARCTRWRGSCCTAASLTSRPAG